MASRIVIVGGGISGLAVSYEILERMGRAPPGTELLCLEALDRPGGNIRTERAEGFIAEWGPNGFLDNVPATLELVRRLGMQDRVFQADLSASNRFIYRAGRLRKLPGGPLSFLFSDVLTWRGKLRVLREPFGPPPGEGDESVFDFAARRIGAEAARVLVDAMVTGVYAGDSKKLSLKATFPKMWRMEREHGSLTRAMLRKRREAREKGTKAGGPAGPGGRLTSFRDGLDDITGRLAGVLGPALRLNSRVLGLSRTSDGRFGVRLSDGEAIEASAVVLACPSWFASEVAASLDPAMGKTLAEIPSAAILVVHLGFRETEIGGPPDGFGYLVPRGEGLRILGTIWASSVFPGRAPEGKVLLTTMMGGAHDPDAIRLSDEEAVSAVRGEIEKTMGNRAAPVFRRIFRHPKGIPQYMIGHPARLEALESRLLSLPGLFVSGNSYKGISVNSCVEEAPRIAESVLDFLIGISRVPSYSEPCP